MLQGIVRFGDETVREVMTSRQDIVALNINSPFSDVLKSIIEIIIVEFLFIKITMIT